MLNGPPDKRDIRPILLNIRPFHGYRDHCAAPCPVKEAKMDISGEGLLVILVVALSPGWLAGHIVQGTGLGLVGDLAALPLGRRVNPRARRFLR